MSDNLCPKYDECYGETKQTDKDTFLCRGSWISDTCFVSWNDYLKKEIKKVCNGKEK